MTGVLLVWNVATQSALVCRSVGELAKVAAAEDAELLFASEVTPLTETVDGRLVDSSGAEVLRAPPTERTSQQRTVQSSLPVTSTEPSAEKSME